MDFDFDPDVQCPQWLEDEHKYISSLQSESKDDKAKAMYLEATEHLKHAQWVHLLAYHVHEPHYFVQRYSTILDISSHYPQHADQHLWDATEAVKSAHTALAALEAALPASLSHTVPWILGNLNIMLSHVILDFRRQNFQGQVSDFILCFAQNNYSRLQDLSTNNVISAKVWKDAKLHIGEIK